jgi:hypothetical protein
MLVNGCSPGEHDSLKKKEADSTTVRNELVNSLEEIIQIQYWHRRMHIFDIIFQKLVPQSSARYAQRPFAFQESSVIKINIVRKGR